MEHPTLKEERRFWKQGYARVACVDEAGRGPLAGPVVAAAVVFRGGTFVKIRDSKQLTLKKREELYKLLVKHSALSFGVGIVSPKIIDKINILQATKLAIKKAVLALKVPVDFLIVDGNMRIDLSLPQKAIVKADQKVFSCAAASIIAKVTRDRLMARYHKQYPKYGFAKHKGYGTKTHLRNLTKYGPCPIHRKTFAPVAKTLAKY